MDLSNTNSLRAIEEAEMLRKINCDYVISYIDGFKEQHFSVIITEYCESGDLKRLIHNYRESNKLLTIDLITNYSQQLINGLCYLHDNKIIHRDIKPENIFVLQSGKLKYGDLGISRLFSSWNEMTKIVGSPNYMSPEIVLEKEYNCKSDVWSLGCVFYELITLKKLFQGTVCFNIFHQILNKPIDFNIQTSDKFKFILFKSLEKNIELRAEALELKSIIEVRF